MLWYLLLELLWQTPPYGQKTLLKSKKNIFQISHLIFWKLQAAKYLIYDFTFTLSFFFIRGLLLHQGWAGIPARPCSSSDPSSTGPFFIYLEYLDAKEMMDKVEISVWNIWMREAARRREVAGRLERQLKEDRRANWMASLRGPGSARGGRCHMLM